MLCFETYSQGVVGVGSTAAELEERVQSGGPQAGRPSGTDVCAGNIHGRKLKRKAYAVEGARCGGSALIQPIAGRARVMLLYAEGCPL